jgi:AtzE family amidohydrolase
MRTKVPAVTESAGGIARAVRAKQLSATEVTKAALESIRLHDPAFNCFTTVMEESALKQAESLDRRIAAGESVGPLAGVPFAVKNLFDISGITTLAGSKINRERPPAERSATAVVRLKKAGAILLGALNMDEYAYGFTTENTHYGPTRNPHDPDRVAGGSSGGSAAAVAAGMAPITLGSDTNGSIRVPAAFCGVFGLKPTYGRVSRAGAFLFAESLDHVGPFARSVQDLALAFDVLNGPDLRDPVCSVRPPESTAKNLEEGATGLRIGIAADAYFNQGDSAALAAVANVAKALKADGTITIPHIEKARAAAYLITACEGASLHLPDLRTRPGDFDPAVIERFQAGALMPAVWYLQAQRFRSVFRDHMGEIFRSFDVILAPTAPCAAIRTGEPTIVLGGKELSARPNIGIFTQPFSFVGLPIVSVPVFEPGSLPYGVQIIGAPYNEQAVLRVAWELEKLGVARAHAPVLKEAV